MKPTIKTKLLRFFEDAEITREMIAEETGIAAGYLRNMFGKKSDPLTDSAKYKIAAAFPGTIAILLPQCQAPVAYPRDAALGLAPVAEQEEQR